MLSSLTLTLFLIGCAGSIFSIIYLLINVIKKSEKKRLGFKLAGGFAGLAVASILIQGFTNNPQNNNKNSMQANVQVTKANETSKKASTVTNETKKEEVNKVNETKKRENIIGTSNKDFAKLSDSKPTSVINDKTGNWKLSRVSSSENVIEYVLSYYKNNFTNSNEIHFIVNFTLKTTTRVSRMLDNVLVVNIYEHVDKEELDANKLCTGMKLGEYWIYIDNGDIEKIK